LGVLFTLQDNLTFDKVLEDLADLDLRIGIHVQGFASDGSESFVNTPPPPNVGDAPELATMILFGFGLIGLARIGRTRKMKLL
jgi:hypothetical protein